FRSQCTTTQRYPTLFPYTTLFRSNLAIISYSSFCITILHTKIGYLSTAYYTCYFLLVNNSMVSSGIKLLPPVNLAPHTGTCFPRSEEHTSELQSRFDLVCRLLLEK